MEAVWIAIQASQPGIDGGTKLKLKSVVAATALVVASSAMASSAMETIVKTCSNYSDTAALIMGARQRGVRLSKVMQTLMEHGPFEDGTDLQKTMLLLAHSAYAKPNYRTKELKRRAITEFSNDAFSACYQLLFKHKKSLND